MRSVYRVRWGPAVRVGGFAGAVLLAFALIATMGRGWSPAALAQDGTPQPDEEAVVARPAHIHAGTCADLDPTPLFPLTDVAAPAGEATGPAAVTPVETSVSTVARTLTRNHA